MDRALNRDDIAFALGSHPRGTLPTVEELIDLISSVEIQAFSTIGPIDPQLVETAWYLHGVASVSNASELYNPERQRRAFSVSAHIFDLALHAPQYDRRERLNLAFATQVGYRRSALDPNATAIWRRVAHEVLDINFEDEALQENISGLSRDSDTSSSPSSPETDLAPGSRFSLMALCAGVAFLGLDIRRTSELLAVWHERISTLRELLRLETLFSTMFGPAEQIVLAVHSLIDYLRYGDRSTLEAARASLSTVVDMTAGRGDSEARWIAAHLLTISDGLEDSSIWSVLPPDTPSEVAQAFTFGSPPVLTLWPPQRDLLKRNVSNPLDPQTKRMLLSIPTSAGKTLLAQIIMCHHLATVAGDICYVTPLRSLGREMRQALSTRLHILEAKQVSDWLDFASLDLETLADLFSNDRMQSSIEILTPEQLSHMLRHDPEGTLARFSMFVIDEAQLIAQNQRGFLLESILSILKTSEARLILLSGVMGNGDQVASWLDSSHEGVLFSSTWRGPRQIHSIFYSDIDWKTARDLRSRSAERPIRKEFDVHGVLHVKPVEGRIRHLEINKRQALGVKQLEYLPDGTSSMVYRDGSTPFYHVAAKAARTFLRAGSVLMIVSQRNLARNAAKTLADELVSTALTEPLVEFLSQRLGEEHPLIACVHKGVGYHHAGLPVDVLEALEEEVRSGNLNALVATSTLAEGVNLPVRTVVIAETIHPNMPPGQRLDPARLLNAIGRAGRAGRETDGWIVLALAERPSTEHFDRLRPDDDSLQIQSVLTTNQALEDLTETENLLDESTDVIFSAAINRSSDFISFVWFVLSAQERLQNITNHYDLTDSIHGLLAFKQMTPELTIRWQNLAKRVAEVYAATPAESRRRWAAAGTSLGTARRLENQAQIIANHILNAISEDPAYLLEGLFSLDETLDFFAATNTFEILRQMPEGAQIKSLKNSAGSASEAGLDVLPIVRNWIAGTEMPDLAEATFPEVTNEAARLEKMVDLISTAFEHYFSWTIAIVINHVNEILAEYEVPIRISQGFSSMIKYGVDTNIALALISRGLRSRQLAFRIGRQAESSGFEFREIIEWLRQQHIQGWRSELQASSDEILNLLDLVRETSKNSLLRQLLTSGEATADLHSSSEAYTSTELEVSLQNAAPHKEVNVWTKGNASNLVGYIAVAQHSDLLAVMSAGLSYEITCNGTEITIKTTG